MPNLLVTSKRTATIIALALTLAVGLGFAFIKLVAAQTNDEAAVRLVLTRSATGFERGDLAMLNGVYANDESVTIFESGHANYGRSSADIQP